MCPEPCKVDLKELEEELYKLEEEDELGKEEPLVQDSCLGYIISLLKINLIRLIGGRHFIILYIVLKNKYIVPLTTLINSRANGFAFINTAYAIDITKFFNLKL
jgi:hypothetical protein